MAKANSELVAETNEMETKIEMKCRQAVKKQKRLTTEEAVNQQI
jgi:hypothetical protein